MDVKIKLKIGNPLRGPCAVLSFTVRCLFVPVTGFLKPDPA